jgi:hypothetical protein
MKIFVSILYFFCIFLVSGLAIPVAHGAEHKGLQLIGLSMLSETSVLNCAQAVNESNPDIFEFTFMPFFNNTEYRFVNAQILLDNIKGIKKIETIYLGWRDEKELKSTPFQTRKDTITLRASLVNAHIRDVRSKVDKIVLVPILEDVQSLDEWVELCRAIASQLESGDKVSFRRNPMKDSTASRPRSSLSLYLKGQAYPTSFETDYELHKIVTYKPDDPEHVASNDGDLVYQDAPLNGMSDLQEVYTSGFMKLDAWILQAYNSSKVSLLWRPSYNLFTRSISPENEKRYIYNTNGLTLDNRSDDSQNPCINDFEQSVIRQFLGSSIAPLIAPHLLDGY